MSHSPVFASSIAFASLLFLVALSGKPVAGLVQCKNTTTFCQTQCCDSQYSPSTQGCISRVDASTCCKPGPANPPSTSMPNCLVIGDSVSIGYTPVVVKELASVCAVQHGPWDVSDGGAASTGNGVACLDNWLVTQNQTRVKWDVIQFNFGLHDLDNSSSAEALYEQQLTNITKRLMATGAKLQYALTTPYMPDATQGNMVVDQLNTIATKIMVQNRIPVVDLHTLVTSHCGIVYENCDWCRKSPCSYHYNPQGYDAIGEYVANAFKARLRDA